MIDDLLSGFWPGEPLEKLLKNQSRRENSTAPTQRIHERVYLRTVVLLVSPQEQ